MAVMMIKGMPIGGKGSSTPISSKEGNIIKREISDNGLYATVDLETQNIDFSDFFTSTFSLEEEGGENNG